MKCFLNEPTLAERRFDGIFGLAYDTLAVDHTVPPFYSMVNQKLVEKSVFSFRIGPSESDGGEVVFGGIDPAHYTGTIEYFPVTKKGYWQIGLQTITMGPLVSLSALQINCKIIDDDPAILSLVDYPVGWHRCRHRHRNISDHGPNRTCQAVK